MGSVASTAPAGVSERGLNLSMRVIRFGPALILVVLLVIMTVASPFFMTGDNISNVAVQVAPLACLAVGQLFVILVGGIDLSVGSLLALCTVTGALAYGWGGPFVIPGMILIGAAVGLLNGVMLVKGRMPHAFIPTLATLNAARGLALMLSDGAPMPACRRSSRPPAPASSARSRCRSSSSPPSGCSRGCWRRACSGGAGSTSWAR